MTTITTSNSSKPPTDLDLVTEFARKTVQAGEDLHVHNLWDNHYRINYYLRDKSHIGRSVLVSLSGGKIEVSKVQ